MSPREIAWTLTRHPDLLISGAGFDPRPTADIEEAEFAKLVRRWPFLLLARIDPLLACPLRSAQDGAILAEVLW